MKRLLLFALCALFALNAEARTIYVDAKRPNNKGSGLSKAKAKKTIQAAINVAKAGDTILVYPGSYAPIRTNNRKVAVKSVKGPGKTSIKGRRSTQANWCLDLGKWNGTVFAGGKATRVKGFACMGQYPKVSGMGIGGIIGGTASFCSFDTFQADVFWQGYDNFADPDPLKSRPLFHRASIADSILIDCYQSTELGILMSGCSVQRSSIACCSGQVLSTTLCNSRLWSSEYALYEYCLDYEGFRYVAIALTDRDLSSGDYRYGPLLDGCTLYNCTVTSFGGGRLLPAFRNGTAVNTVFWKVPSNIYSGQGNTFVRCLKGTNPKLVSVSGLLTAELKKGSPCIDKGKLTKKQKKLVGSKDIYGRRRIRGKAVDIGCYEY